MAQPAIYAQVGLPNCGFERPIFQLPLSGVFVLKAMAGLVSYGTALPLQPRPSAVLEGAEEAFFNTISTGTGVFSYGRRSRRLVHQGHLIDHHLRLAPM